MKTSTKQIVRAFYFAVFAVVMLIFCGPALAGTDDPQFFESKVRPILEQNCFKCHGQKKQKSGMRLDSLKGMLRGGARGAALSPGRPQESRIIQAVSRQDPDLQMPADGKLSDQQIAILTQWVQSGAAWPGVDLEKVRAELAAEEKELRSHWAFQPPVKPTVLMTPDGGWSRNEIDRFIYPPLAEHQIPPTPEADRQTLIRRLYFDLLGLPPTPQEVRQFVSDPSPRAYENLVDRLLASPHYGQRQARLWLDLVRYADSDGHAPARAARKTGDRLVL